MIPTVGYRPRPHNPYFHLPAQIILGIVFFLAGFLLLAKKLGNDYLPFLPEDLLVLVCALGCAISGIYMIIVKFHRPRIYL